MIPNNAWSIAVDALAGKRTGDIVDAAAVDNNEGTAGRTGPCGDVEGGSGHESTGGAVAGAHLMLEQARLDRLIAEKEIAVEDARRTAEQLGAPGHSVSWWLCCGVVAVASIMAATAMAL